MDPYRTPSADVRVLPSQPAPGVRVGAVVRDVVIVLLLTGIGGFIIGVALRSPTPGTPQTLAAIGASNLLLSIIGFTISGVLARGARWRHLAIVATIVWLVSAVNVPTVGLALWLAGAPLTAIIVAVGGALSYVFRRDAQG